MKSKNFLAIISLCLVYVDGSPEETVFHRSYDELVEGNATNFSAIVILNFKEDETDMSSILNKLQIYPSEFMADNYNKDDELNLPIKFLRSFKSCYRKAAKVCTKACVTAAKDACSYASCQKKLKNELKKQCKRSCKSYFLK